MQRKNCDLTWTRDHVTCEKQVILVRNSRLHPLLHMTVWNANTFTIHS